MKKIIKIASVIAFIIAFLFLIFLYFKNINKLKTSLKSCEYKYEEFKKDYNRESDMMKAELEIRDNKITELENEIKALKKN